MLCASSKSCACGATRTRVTHTQVPRRLPVPLPSTWLHDEDGSYRREHSVGTAASRACGGSGPRTETRSGTARLDASYRMSALNPAERAGSADTPGSASERHASLIRETRQPHPDLELSVALCLFSLQQALLAPRRTVPHLSTGDRVAGA
eukprot:2709759-Rhodomonas_salina.3